MENLQKLHWQTGIARLSYCTCYNNNKTISGQVNFSFSQFRRQGAVYKIKCCDYQATYIGETGRNLNVRLTEHKRATRNGNINNHIAEHHLQTNHRIDWDSAKCITYTTNYYQRLNLESWFTNLEQMPLNRCLQLPAPYKRLIDNINETDKQ